MEDSQFTDALQLIGYFPGAVGKITELHATYYYDKWDLDISFETQVGGELSEFMENFNEDRDGFWIAMVGEQFAGSIVIDGRESYLKGGRLRWFIVPPEYQGRGIGRILLRRGITFCKEMAYKKIYLWTFKGLDRACTLYQKEGFQLMEEIVVSQWGTVVTAQKYELPLS
jgi:GNAT superfamily N-acetyltransferase